MSLLAKATLTLALGLAAARVARRARASTRHFVLACTFAVLLALPLASRLVPDVTVEVPLGEIAAPAAQRTVAGVGVLRGVEGGDSVETPSRSVPQLRTLLLRAWWAVAALLMAGLGVGLRRFGRLARRGVPWPESRTVLAAICAEAGVRRPVDIVLHEELSVPATCGWWRPVVVLPMDALDWSDADLRRALVHETEHVKRRDWAVHLLARAACALFWFHPLAWMAYRQLCLEAERACDDAVLEHADGPDYAAQLVQLARRLSASSPPPALSMATRSDLSARVTAILDGRQARGRADHKVVAALGVAALTIAAAVAPIRAVPAPVSASFTTASEAQARARNRAIDQELFEAAGQGDVEAVSSLVAAGADVNAILRGDGSPLIAAARGGRLEAVRLLLDRSADPNLIVPGDGSPLIMAAREGHAAIVALLLDRGALVDQVAPGDENALIQASGSGELAVVKLLVARGADVNARVWAENSWSPSGAYSGEWRTPLSMARRGGHAGVVAYLLSAGARE